MIPAPARYTPLQDDQREIETTMSFSDLSKKNAQPHVDTPAQAEARAQAAADMKAKADARAAKAAAHRAGKTARRDTPKAGSAGDDPKGGPPHP